MEMPKPGEPHAKLERLAGRWIGEETIHPMPWDPEGGTAKGLVDNKPGLDGFAVVQDYEQQRGGVTSFRGHGVFAWDDIEKCYVMHWFDTMGMPPSVFKGDFEGDVLTVTHQGPQGFSRAVFDLSHDGRYHFKMEVSGDGNAWAPFMEGDYARQ